MNDNNRTPDGTQIVYVSHKSIGSFHTMSSNRFLLCPFDVAFISPSFYSPSFFFSVDFFDDVHHQTNTKWLRG